jgi:hypothetical protein
MQYAEHLAPLLEQKLALLRKLKLPLVGLLLPPVRRSAPETCPSLRVSGRRD